MIVKLLTEHHLECLSLKGDCKGSSESTHVILPHCLKSRHGSNICWYSKDVSNSFETQNIRGVFKI